MSVVRARRRSRLVLLLATLALVGVVGVPPTSVAAGPAPTELALTFVAPDGTPVPGVCVELDDPGYVFAGRGCAPADSAELVIGGLVPGVSYRFSMTAPDGFADLWYPHAVEFRYASVVHAGERVLVTMTPAGHIQGRLLMDSRHPADASVTAEPAAPLVGSSNQVSTDRSGRYRMKVAPGRYRVLVWYGWWSSQYAYGTTDRNAATVFTVRAGDELRVDDVLPTPSSPFASVGGRITATTTGRGVPGLCVDWIESWQESLQRSLTPCYSGTTTLADGRYRLAWLPSGSTGRLVVRDPAHRYPTTRSAVVTLTSRRIDDLDVTVSRAGDLTGVVGPRLGPSAGRGLPGWLRRPGAPRPRGRGHLQ